MSQILSDDVLSNVREIRSILRSWRQSRLASASVVNASFDIRATSVTYTNAPDQPPVCLYEPNRVALLVMVVGTSSVYLVPDFGNVDAQGTLISYPQYFMLDIHRHPALVALGWRFGSMTSLGSIVNVIEILDRRQR